MTASVVLLISPGELQWTSPMSANSIPTPPRARSTFHATRSSVTIPRALRPVPCDARTIRLRSSTPFRVNGVSAAETSSARCGPVPPSRQSSNGV